MHVPLSLDRAQVHKLRADILPVVDRKLVFTLPVQRRGVAVPQLLCLGRVHLCTGLHGAAVHPMLARLHCRRTLRTRLDQRHDAISSLRLL